MIWKLPVKDTAFYFAKIFFHHDSQNSDKTREKEGGGCS
jgi:hypothetical protein